MRMLMMTSALIAATLAVPAFAQTTPPPAAPANTTAPAATAPAQTATPKVMITAPEGYIFTETGSVTADELKGVKIYDPTGKDVGEISDIELGADNKLAHVITDVGGFLGMGEHRVALSPAQIQIYKNSSNEMRAYVTATMDELKALPTYKEPNP